MWDPRRLTTLWAPRPDTGIALPLPLTPTVFCYPFVFLYKRTHENNKISVSSFKYWRCLNYSKLLFTYKTSFSRSIFDNNYKSGELL
jgi:hypothetical protein